MLGDPVARSDELCASPGKPLGFSEPQFSHLYVGSGTVSLRGLTRMTAGGEHCLSLLPSPLLTGVDTRLGCFPLAVRLS